MLTHEEIRIIRALIEYLRAGFSITVSKHRSGFNALKYKKGLSREAGELIDSLSETVRINKHLRTENRKNEAS